MAKRLNPRRRVRWVQYMISDTNPLWTHRIERPNDQSVCIFFDVKIRIKCRISAISCCGMSVYLVGRLEQV